MSDEQEVPQSIPDAGTPAPSSEPAAPPPPLHWTNEDSTTQYAEHFAKGEDVEDYARYRQGVEDFEAGTLSNDRKAHLQRQILDATEEAARAADGLSSEPDEQPFYPGEDYISRAEADRAVAQAKAQQRMEVYFPDPAMRQEIGQTISLYDPAPAIIDHIIESPYGPQIAERLAEHPEAIFDLNDRSPAETKLILSRLEGALMAEQDFARRIRDTMPEQRQSKAPPPIRPPKGQAMPPSDPFRLATKDDVTDYIRARKGQEKSHA